MVGSVVEIVWSSDVGDADWIRERLSGAPGASAVSIVPGGFEAYARILHPATALEGGSQRCVRWSEVASWGGLSVQANARFHSVALPAEAAPGTTLPDLVPPHRGTLGGEHIKSLIP